MHTITLELLRHGPAHNQLLSPLTPYLALCENHGAVTIHVPFEHNQFLHRLAALGYRVSDEARNFQLKDTASVLGDLLGTVPGLTAETNKQNCDAEQMTHLRLIISASELALLPFELALAPAGLPGAGQHLLLQPQMPVCLTREVRRAPDDSMTWPAQAPRILFVAAAPPKNATIPLEAHLLALRRVIAPWVKYYDPDDANARDKVLRDHFVFLPNASLEAIESECASSSFTHVHILAHGVSYEDGHDTRFGLALHDARNPERTDRVSGTRLATALRAAGRSGNNALSQPTVVTMASCDAANGGSVAGAGSSIAHALHEAGIAMVVAGQFPLSFEGSVRLVEVLYDGLLWGADPRRLIFDVRRRLYSQFPLRHDWASLTTYLSLPPDFEQQLSAVKIKQAWESINAAMSLADEAIRRQNNDLLEQALRRMVDGKGRLTDLIAGIPEQKAKIHGLLASAEKRQAQVLYNLRDDAIPKGGRAQSKTRLAESRERLAESEKLLADSKKLLVDARGNYWEAFQNGRALHWAVVQYLSLGAVIARISDLMTAETTPVQPVRTERSPKELWSMARLQSLYDLNDESRETRSWAHGNLIELYLLSLLPDFKGLVTPADAERLAIQSTDQLISTAGWGSFEAYSTRRQLQRYFDWYKDLTGAKLEPLLGLAKKLFDRFPSEVEHRH